jgi:DNA-binding transcriptional MerR regulator
MSANQSMNINEASKACGLSPSVLRIWELRYGWPNPKRKANGYRAYNQHQVQELKRVAELVKGGTPISSLIIDGLPRWPADHTHKRLPLGLTRSKQLSKPEGVLETKLQQELVESLEHRHTSQVKELLQRAFWSVRPDDEVLTALVPALVGLEELALAERPLAEDGEIRTLVKERCLQLLRRYRKTDGESELWVVAVSDVDQALAALVALILCQRGHHAQPWFAHELPPTGSLLLAGDHQDANALKGDRRVTGRVSSLGGNGMSSLESLLAAPAKPTPLALCPN